MGTPNPDRQPAGLHLRHGLHPGRQRLPRRDGHPVHQLLPPDRFSSGSNHGSSVATAAFWDALYQFGAEMVLVGHEHVYERFAPQTPAAVANPNFGIRQLTVGTGGIGHYSFSNPIANSEVRSTGTFGVLKLTLNAGSYSWQFVPVAGKTFTDSGTGTCHAAP